jgi:hypothetical protein
VADEAEATELKAADAGEQPQSGNPAKTAKAVRRLKIIARQRLVTKLRVRGYTQEEIAKKIKTCVRQVRYDLQRVAQRWEESGIRDTNQLREIQRLRLERNRRVLEDLYKEKHGSTRERTLVFKDADGKTASYRIEEEDIGVDKLLKIREEIRKVDESICKLMALDIPQPPTQYNGNHVNVNVAVGIDEQRSSIAAIASKLGIADIFEPDSQPPSAAVDHASVRSGPGLPAATGIQKNSDDANAASVGLS